MTTSRGSRPSAAHRMPHHDSSHREPPAFRLRPPASRLSFLRRLVAAVCGRTCGPSPLVGCVVLAAILSTAADRKDDLAARAERVAAMSAEQKQRLLELKERFGQLPPREQQRLRELYLELDRRSDGEQLRTVLRNYYRWLSTLSPTERAELLAMPRDKRVQEIESRLRAEERKRFFELSDRQLTPADHEAIHAWLKQVIGKREEKVLERVPQLKSLDPGHRYRRLLGMMMVSFNSSSDRAAFFRPDEDELRELVKRLCPKAQSFLKGLDSPETKRQVLWKWIRTAVHSRYHRPVDNATLLELLKKLPAEQRSRLEELGRNEMFEELRRLYFRQRFPYRPGERGRRPGGNGIGRGGPGRPGSGLGIRPDRFGKPPLKGIPPNKPLDNRRGNGAQGNESVAPAKPGTPAGSK